jgi:hypothetical protein
MSYVATVLEIQSARFHERNRVGVIGFELNLHPICLGRSFEFDVDVLIGLTYDKRCARHDCKASAAELLDDGVGYGMGRCHVCTSVGLRKCVATSTITVQTYGTFASYAN